MGPKCLLRRAWLLNVASVAPTITPCNTTPTKDVNRRKNRDRKKLMTWENKRVLRRKMSQWMLLHGKIETPERETETEKKGERNREMSLAHTVHLDTERHLICDARANNLPLHPPVLFPLPISFISVSSIEDGHNCHNGLCMITSPRF